MLIALAYNKECHQEQRDMEKWQLKNYNLNPGPDARPGLMWLVASQPLIPCVGPH